MKTRGMLSSGAIAFLALTGVIFVSVGAKAEGYSGPQPRNLFCLINVNSEPGDVLLLRSDRERSWAQYQSVSSGYRAEFLYSKEDIEFSVYSPAPDSELINSVLGLPYIKPNRSFVQRFTHAGKQVVVNCENRN